jgi:hypothetical protein
MAAERVDRRGFLGRAAAAASALSLPLPELAHAAAGSPAAIPLPDAARIRADFQQMVDFGPRYTGTAGHDKFIDWLEEELVAAGTVMLPRETFPLTVWEAERYGLEVDGERVKVSAYYPRSRETGPDGITGPLVYAGVAPLPALDPGLEDLPAALKRYPDQLASWFAGLTGTLRIRPGSILLVDLPMPVPLPSAWLMPLVTHLHWEHHSLADWLTGDYKRPALLPGIVALPLAPLKALGAAGVVFILDASFEAINGGYMPFENDFEDIPALYVDRDTGNTLRRRAASAPKARLTLHAKRHEGTSPALLGYLPGAGDTDEAMFVDSHTDGEGFVEENGGVAIVHLARHFGSLPASQRLKRTLVFSLWPGHMAAHMPQLGGILDRHQDIVRSAAAGITVEHLGCSEWVDTAEKGYHPTGHPDITACWTTQGKVFEIVRDATIANDVPRTALLRPPVQFGVGGALQSAGVPQIGYLAGPYYLLNDAPGSDMDKLDAGLASKQVAWTADILRRLDRVPAAELAAGDPTLGRKSAGPRAKFPAPPPLELAVTLNAPSRARLLRGGKLHGTVTLNRIGLVRLHAVLEYTRRGRRVRTPIADLLLHAPERGATSYALALTPRGRAALRRVDGGRIVLTARFRERRVAHVRHARRRLQRRTG